MKKNFVIRAGRREGVRAEEGRMWVSGEEKEWDRGWPLGLHWVACFPCFGGRRRCSCMKRGANERLPEPFQGSPSRYPLPSLPQRVAGVRYPGSTCGTSFDRLPDCHCNATCIFFTPIPHFRLFNDFHNTDFAVVLQRTAMSRF